MSCGVGCRRGSDPALLWLWCRLVATAPIRPLAWVPPYATGAAQEMAKGQKKKKKIQRQVSPTPTRHSPACLPRWDCGYRESRAGRVGSIARRREGCKGPSSAVSPGEENDKLEGRHGPCGLWGPRAGTVAGRFWPHGRKGLLKRPRMGIQFE